MPEYSFSFPEKKLAKYFSNLGIAQKSAVLKKVIEPIKNSRLSAFRSLVSQKTNKLTGTLQKSVYSGVGYSKTKRGVYNAWFGFSGLEQKPQRSRKYKMTADVYGRFLDSGTSIYISKKGKRTSSALLRKKQRARERKRQRLEALESKYNALGNKPGNYADRLRLRIVKAKLALAKGENSLEKTENRLSIRNGITAKDFFRNFENSKDRIAEEILRKITAKIEAEAKNG